VARRWGKKGRYLFATEKKRKRKRGFIRQERKGRKGQRRLTPARWPRKDREKKTGALLKHKKKKKKKGGSPTRLERKRGRAEAFLPAGTRGRKKMPSIENPRPHVKGKKKKKKTAPVYHLSFQARRRKRDTKKEEE